MNRGGVYRNTRKAKALLVLDGGEKWGEDEFQRLVNSICQTKEQGEITRNHLQRDGLVERRVMLTEKGKQTIQALKAKND